MNIDTAQILLSQIASFLLFTSTLYFLFVFALFSLERVNQDTQRAARSLVISSQIGLPLSAPIIATEPQKAPTVAKDTIAAPTTQKPAQGFNRRLNKSIKTPPQMPIAPLPSTGKIPAPKNAELRKLCSQHGIS